MFMFCLFSNGFRRVSLLVNSKGLLQGSDFFGGDSLALEGWVFTIVFSRVL